MRYQPIETRYKGCRFRSRLEARWAVFFDTLKIKWEYEKEGFDLDGVYYLPDFWLSEQKCWIEIKSDLSMMTEGETVKAIRFDEAIHRELNRGQDYQQYYIFFGEPYFDGRSHSYSINKVWDYPKDKPPYIRNVSRDCGVWWAHCPLCDRIDLSSHYPQFGWHDDFITEGIQCMYCDCINRNWKETDKTWFHKGIVETRMEGFILGGPRLMEAYQVARSARFEHGESP